MGFKNRVIRLMNGKGGASQLLVPLRTGYATFGIEWVGWQFGAAVKYDVRISRAEVLRILRNTEQHFRKGLRPTGGELVQMRTYLIASLVGACSMLTGCAGVVIGGALLGADVAALNVDAEEANKRENYKLSLINMSCSELGKRYEDIDNREYTFWEKIRKAESGTKRVVLEEMKRKNCRAPSGSGNDNQDRDDLANKVGWATMSRDDIRELQRLLREAGYDPGPIDGLRGKRTEAALWAYQRSSGLQVGEPTLETLRALDTE